MNVLLNPGTSLEESNRVGSMAEALALQVPEVARVAILGSEAVVVHGQQYGAPTPELVVRAHPGAALVVFGHSHVPVIERVGSTLAVNPGSAGPRRFKRPTTVALATVDGSGVHARLLQLLAD